MDLDALKNKPRPKQKKGAKGPNGGVLIKGKKCFECGKISYFARDYRSKNKIIKKNTLIVINQYYLNVTIIILIENYPTDGQP